ncbi:MAG: hypothetical protein ACRC5Q_03340 [Culicoidibacterales bacterium]
MPKAHAIMLNYYQTIRLHGQQATPLLEATGIFLGQTCCALSSNSDNRITADGKK